MKPICLKSIPAFKGIFVVSLQYRIFITATLIQNGDYFVSNHLIFDRTLVGHATYTVYWTKSHFWGYTLILIVQQKDLIFHNIIQKQAQFGFCLQFNPPLQFPPIQPWKILSGLKKDHVEAHPKPKIVILGFASDKI